MDTGPGVPADRRAAIFEDFEQGDGSNARHYEGTGLGLAISKRIVALMGGELVLADNPGGGSIFSFAIRFAGARRRAARGRAGRARGPPRADHRPFAVRSAGDRGSAERGGRRGRARRGSRGRARRAERGRRSPISSSSIARLASRRPIAWRSRRASPGRPRAWCCSRRSSGAPSARPRCKVSTAGWSSRCARARCSIAWRASSRPPPARRRRRAPTASPAARAMRALLAEDNDINAVVAQKALRRLGFEVVRARDGEEATRLAGAATRGAVASLRRRPDGHQDARRRRLRSGARAFAASSARPARRASRSSR